MLLSLRRGRPPFRSLRPRIPLPEAGERIRIAHVIARLNVGGPAVHVTSLAAHLPSERFESRLYTGSVSPGEMEMTDALEREGIDPVRVPGLGRAIRSRDDVQALARLVGELRRFRPHIVHTNTAKAGALGRLAGRLCGVPVVVHTFHGHVFEGYFSPIVARAFIVIERALGQLSDAVVTLSPSQRADIVDRYRIVSGRTAHVVPLGFDLTRFTSCGQYRGGVRHDLGLDGAPLVAIVGRLTRVKDHQLLFEAIALLDPAVHLCVVGGGEDETALRKHAEGLGIAPRVHFMGFRNDLERILADTDVVALTSHNEGTPVALIEAMAAGCSIVATSVGGVPDVLQGGRWGRLVPDRTPPAVASALAGALREHRSRPLDVVEAARHHALDKYGVERLILDHVRLYEDLLERAGE